MDFKKLIRYRTLDTCFRDRGKLYTKDDLFEAITQAYHDNGFETDVKLRQLQYDLEFMQSSEGWNIQLNTTLKVGRKTAYRYENTSFSIFQKGIHPLFVDYLEMAKYVLDCHKNEENFEWLGEFIPKIEQEIIGVKTGIQAIQFDKNEYLQGLEHIETLAEAISDKTVLEIQYQPFGKPSMEVIFHPYLLKAYNNRWFLLGKNEAYPDNLTNFALDRITDFNAIYEHTFIPSNIDFEDYFDDMIGVSRTETDVIEQVELLFDKGRAGYVQTKPLHHSQKKEMQENGDLLVKLRLIVNRELIQQILQFGADVQVLAPESLVDTIQANLLKNLANYNL